MGEVPSGTARLSLLTATCTNDSSHTMLHDAAFYNDFIWNSYEQMSINPGACEFYDILLSIAAQ